MSGNVGIFVDLILLALLLIGLVLGWRQGLVQALTRIIVVVAALLLASWIAGKLAEPAARWLEPILSEKLEQRLTAQGNTDDAGEMLAAFGFEGDTLSELVDNAVEKAQQAGETLLSAVVSTALKSAAYAVVYVVSFFAAAAFAAAGTDTAASVHKTAGGTWRQRPAGRCAGLGEMRAAAVPGGVGAAEAAAAGDAGAGEQNGAAQIFRPEQPHRSDR